MTRSLFFLTLLAAGLAVTTAFGGLRLAAFRWSETDHNFGRIPQGQPVTATFAFTNSSTVPLQIVSAKGSCGCTNVSFTREQVLPGQAGQVQATFNAAAVGAFSKTVTVESNAEGGPITLAFRGEVVTALSDN